MSPPASIRQALRARRRSLHPRQQREHAAKVTHRIGRMPVFLRARRIALYWPSDGEMDPRPLMTLAHARSKRVYLPVLRPLSRQKGHDRLWFARHITGARTRANRFGIPEPIGRGRHLIRTQGLDLMILPLVGFDADCNRLGMGGGFYDRTLAYLRRHDHWRRPRLIGIAHECQRLDHIATRPWDIPLDAVLTESHAYIKPKGRQGWSQGL